MAQEPVEVILAKQLAGLLSVPILVFNAAGDLTYYNEATERLTGLRFNETGRISRDAVKLRFRMEDRDKGSGAAVTVSKTPVLPRRPGRSRFVSLAPSWEEQRELDATTIPLISVSGELVGTLMMLWEPDAG